MTSHAVGTAGPKDSKQGGAKQTDRRRSSRQVIIVKNLGHIPYNDKDCILKDIQILKSRAGRDSYVLSNIVLVTAVSGQEDDYHPAVANFLSSLGLKRGPHLGFSNGTQLRRHILKLVQQQGKPIGFWTWLLSRTGLAADQMLDLNLSRWLMHAAHQLIKHQKDAPRDEYFAWSWGYLSAYFASHQSRLIDFHRDKQVMFSATEAMANRLKSVDKNDKPQLVSALIWARVLDAYASALAGDMQTYTEVLKALLEDAGAKTLGDALIQVLPDDNRAWAIGFARLAAATIGDSSGYEILAKPLAKAIKRTTLLDDRTLAILYDTLGQVRWRQFREGQVQTNYKGL